MPLLLGTLDLLVLHLLASGPMHGYGIASLVRELTSGDLAIEDAALYRLFTGSTDRGSWTLSGDRPTTTAALDRLVRIYPGG